MWLLLPSTQLVGKYRYHQLASGTIRDNETARISDLLKEWHAQIQKISRIQKKARRAMAAFGRGHN